MSLLCVADCASVIEAVPTNYHDPCEGDILRKFGWKQFVVVSCDYQFTDLLDTDEWQAARDLGKVGISPEGRLDFNQPNQDSFEIDGCGREVADEAEILIDFGTYQTKDDLSDFDYWKSLYQRHAGYRILPVDCNGIFYISDSYKAALVAGGGAITVAGESPGLEFSMPRTPMPLAGANPNFVYWTMQLQIKFTDVLCATYLPGVLTALGTDTPIP